jgi:hypothetical protein
MKEENDEDRRLLWSKCWQYCRNREYNISLEEIMSAHKDKLLSRYQ